MQVDYQKQWKFLKNKFKSNQLSHAYLFSGRDENSIKELVKKIIKLINCPTSADNQDLCGKCYSCSAIEKENFPDFLVVKSAYSKNSIKDGEDKGEISIGQIRDINNFLNVKPFYGSFKTVLVENAERMNLEAQSCFLKTLEDPKGKTLIILISSNLEILLPTVISRCQTIKFFPSRQDNFSEEENKIILEFSRIADLSIAEKFAYVKSVQLSDEKFRKILSAARSYFRNILLEKIGVAKTGNFSNRDKIKGFSVVKVQAILGIIEDIYRKHLFYNINQKLSLEALLMEI